MKLAHSLHKKTLEASVGHLLNKFKLRKRRDTLFFEDILSEYVKLCEEKGIDTSILARKWVHVTLFPSIPSYLKKLPIEFLYNSILNKVWANLGIFDSIHFEKVSKDVVRITVMDESETRSVGPNKGMIGFHIGVLEVLTGKKVVCLKAVQTREKSVYELKIIPEKAEITVGKSKKEYDAINALKPIKGFTLKDAMEKRIIHLKSPNKIFFRGKRICFLENTFFHILSNETPFIDKIADISYEYFKHLINSNSTKNEKLKLLKSLLQIMGWGIVSFIVSGDSITLDIKHPPHGYQKEKDNLAFIANTVLGYLRLINGKLKIKEIRHYPQELVVKYVV